MAAALHIACSSERAAPPSVILISIDTLRADRLAAVDTPAIDQLAADGIVFEHAYAHVPLTLPSHVSMLTGKLPYQTGVRSNVGYRMTSSADTLPRLLAARGYATGAAVSAYVIRGETGLGPLFDFYDDSMEVSQKATLGALQRRGDETIAAALGWLDKSSKQPLFLFIHLFEPHSPYEPSYDGEIEKTDAIVARFIGELKRRGLYDDAMIILTADHGEGLGDHGEAEHGVLLYREALHVPLIIKLPKQQRAGTRVQTPVQHIDLLPTVATVVGAPVPNGLAGTSLLDITTTDRTIYAETLYPRLHLGWSELRSLTNATHQYIHGPEPELFDVARDPRQTRNVRDEQRRAAFDLANRLSAIPLQFETAPVPADAEERARLAALGYLSGTAASTEGPLRNPRDHVGVLSRIQEIFVLNEAGRFGESIERCREILKQYPELVDVHLQLAGNLRRVGRLGESLQAYREAMRRSPQLIDSTAIEVAKLELDLGNLQAAELNARQAMKVNGADAHLVLAAVAMERKDWPAAEREARLAFGDPKRPRVPALLLLARILVEQGRLDEALATANAAANRQQPVATLFSTRGDILARMGRSTEAEADFRREIAAFPATTLAYVRLTILLASQKRFKEVEPTLDAMVAASPHPESYRLAARVMTDLGNKEGAARYGVRRP
jgi:tetratricopeptide (TPR) repeat protein